MKYAFIVNFSNFGIGFHPISNPVALMLIAGNHKEKNYFSLYAIAPFIKPLYKLA